jgi:hypothetical protein
MTNKEGLPHIRRVFSINSISFILDSDMTQAMTIEKADYILKYYSKLLQLKETIALRHHRSELKLSDSKNGPRRKLYLRIGWLSNDPEILNQLNQGYIQFMLDAASRIVQEFPDKVFFNYCPVCRKLARTPDAKQCRLCGHDWH